MQGPVLLTCKVHASGKPGKGVHLDVGLASLGCLPVPKAASSTCSPGRAQHSRRLGPSLLLLLGSQTPL